MDKMERDIEAYHKACDYIFQIPKFKKKNEMQDTGEFFEFLGKPASHAKIIHVAGTNGKGSVCSYLNAILKETGTVTGMFTSPHLVEMTERIRIQGMEISRQSFTEAFRHVQTKLFNFQKKYHKEYHPSFFEFLFFMAMVTFEQNKTECILLETGLGGRMDATNIIENPTVVVLTRIGMDHMEYLGDTLQSIAKEKAGIIKSGVPVVYYAGRNNVSAIIEKKAKDMGAVCYPIWEKNWEIIEIKKKYIDFSLQSRYYKDIRLNLSTGALYQIENASIAAEAAGVLQSVIKITEEEVKAGIQKAHWAGRMEEVLPGVYLDGAHNEDGIDAFLETVKQDGCKGRRMLLFSVVRDKDYKRMITCIVKSKLFSIIAVTAVDNLRAVSGKELLENFIREKGVQYILYDNAPQAFKYLCHQKNCEDFVYAAGSLYLVGEIKNSLGGFLE